MKIGSLFSGIGGLELGLERAIPGAHTVWQVEQDEYARAVLAKHWPNARRYEDVKEAGAHNLEPVDVICGGFPCQDISVAGKGAGLDGARSGLWTEYARIVRELRPRYVVVENVAALLSRGMGRVLGDLAALGYDATWDCVPAAAVGAHHRRDRLFLVAWSVSDANSSTIRHRAKRTKGGRHYIQGQRQPKFRHNGASQFMAYADSKRKLQPRKLCGQEWRRSINRCRPWTVEPCVGRVATGVPRRVDRLRCLGNAVVPQVAEVVGRVIMELEHADL